MLCKKCNRTIADDARFCPYCGTGVCKAMPDKPTVPTENGMLKKVSHFFKVILFSSLTVGIIIVAIALLAQAPRVDHHILAGVVITGTAIISWIWKQLFGSEKNGGDKDK